MVVLLGFIVRVECSREVHKIYNRKEDEGITTEI